MHDQPKYEPFEDSDFFADGIASRIPVEGTVAWGQLHDDDHFYTGTVDGKLVTTFPFKVDATVIERGQQRYDIFCSPCHDRIGQGQGMIVQRGFKRPPSLHIERLQTVEVGYLFDVMTRGFGSMYSYASRIPPSDRWAIAAYIRALQFSQSAPVAKLSEEDRKKLGE